jgi:transposase-like protein
LEHRFGVEYPNCSRHGHSSKTLRRDDGKLAIKVPCDRNGAFEPALDRRGI